MIWARTATAPSPRPPVAGPAPSQCLVFATARRIDSQRKGIDSRLGKLDSIPAQPYWQHCSRFPPTRLRDACRLSPSVITLMVGRVVVVLFFVVVDYVSCAVGYRPNP
ncbi:hypothetical protein Pcinc_018552 [Petrolisthes cinctipes]|uniref:Uncharacterized protein n=1 Tax=Petrolisthes cinctipes TaxID=88211 RepID=A0AAE1FLX1_PETCI|nr:hypothetical protein Pcinc_018552 [Petrolisthes cinctipes]